MMGDSGEKSYSTTNSTYGWKAPTNVNPSVELRKARMKSSQSVDDKRLNELFWRPTNQEYGAFGFEKNSLCTAVDKLLEVKQARHVLPPQNQPKQPVTQHRKVNISFDNYDISAVRKVENKIYTTTSNEIGVQKPHFGNVLHPHTNDFTKTFLAGPSRDCSLTSTITKNRYHDYI